MDLLNQFKRHLLQDKTKHSRITVKNYLADIRKFINWFENTFHTEFIPSIITKQLAEVYKKHITSPNSQNQVPAARSVKRYLSSLRKFYSFLIINNLAKENPFEIELNPTHTEADLFHLKEFKNYLLLSHASNITRKNYLMDINQFVDWLKNLPEQNNLNKINKVLIEEYKNRLLYEAKFSPVSVNRKLSSLRKYLSWLKNQGFIDYEADFEQIASLSNNIKSIQSFDGHSERSEESKKGKDPSSGKAETQYDKQIGHNDSSDFIYSSFPPMRMFQKLFRFGNSAFDLLFLLPVVKILASIRYQFWKQTGRKVFDNPIDNLITKQDQIAGIKSLPKAFYAPLKISTKNMPFHVKILHHLRHSRPLWYRKYHNYRFVHYLHFGVLLIYTLILGFAVYHELTGASNFQTPVIASLDSPPRVLAFSGRITDATNTPITKEANLRFGLYSDKTATGAALLWQENQIVTPDQDGNFQTTLGQHQSITQDLLNDNPTLFLGITIGNEKELSPRQQIATIAYAKDSEKLQGLSPITDLEAGTSNVILALDSSGNLTIGGKAAPKFEATGGEFTLSGQTLTLTTGIDSNTNIQIAPDGTGIIDTQKPIQNTTNYSMFPGTEGMVQIADSLGIIAESSTQSALLINQNGTGNLISANSYGTAKFTLDNAGNGSFSGDVAVNGNNLTTSSNIFSLLNKNVINLNIGGDASAISIGATSGATMINNSLSIIGKASLKELTADGLIRANAGITVTSGKNLTLEGFNKNSIIFVDANKNLTQDNNFVLTQDSKHLGLGTDSPLYRLDVRDEQSTTSVAQIYNTDSDSNADGLIVKLGSANPGTSNSFVSFQNGNGNEIGKITGSISNGIQIHNGTYSDWAEYIQKDLNETIPFGSLVCIRENGNATACDESESKILGIASENPTVIAGKNLGNGSIAVGLTGLVKTLVTSANGNIKPGDLITSSTTPGVGVKAIQEGMVVGRALEGYENSNASQIGSILVVLQTTWYDPEVELTQSGDLNNQPSISPLSTSLPESTLISNIIDNITTGLFEAKNISTQSLTIATDNITIGSKTLKEYITSIVTDAIEANNQKLLANIKKDQSLQIPQISPTPQPTLIPQISLIPPVDLIASTSAVASNSAIAITNITNIYNNISSQSATKQNTQTNQNLGLSEISDNRIGSNSGYPTNLNSLISSDPQSFPSSLNTDFPRFDQGILALGASSLTDVSITGQLHVGENTILSENTINTIGTNLELQPLRQGNLSIMGELVTIDTEGNLNVNGNANFAKNVTIEGTLAANIISPIPDKNLIIKLGTKNHESISNQANIHDSFFMIHDSSNQEVLSINQLGDLIASGTGQFKNLATEGLSIIRGAQADTSFTETVASGSAGTAIITAYEKERTIKTPFVKKDSLIYISPVSNTQGITPYIARQTAENANTKGSFTIQIPQSITKDIKINWWIVN